MRKNRFRLQGVLTRIAIPRWFASRAVFVVLLTTLVYSGVLNPIEGILSDWRFRFATRPASQTLTIVEIDSTSLQTLDNWPWPRGYFATAIGNLRKAGARVIGIDVDMSGRADPSENAKLLREFAAGDHDVILPTFIQTHRDADGKPVLSEIQPEKPLREGVLLASVNMLAEDDGILRRGFYAFPARAGDRHSMAAALANKAPPRYASFYIDYGISRASIPHVSFADVLANNFDPGLVRGRNILIGATALELGDEFAVPVYGIASGVYLLALGYESIHQNRTLVRPSPLLSLLIALFVMAVLDWRGAAWSWVSVSLRHVAVLVIGVGATLAIQYCWPVSLDAAPIVLAQLLCLGKVVLQEFEGRADEIYRQRALHARQQQLVMFAVKDSSEGIVVTDSVGRIELFNDRAAALFAVKDPARVIGSNISEIVPDFPICPVGEASSGGGRLVPVDCFPVSRPYKLADLDLEISADRTLCEGSHVRKLQAEHIFVYTIRDISARVRIEAAEREVKENLAIASAAKTHFIHNMGHELRTPLNAIIGFSDLICAGFDETSGNPRHLEYVGYIREGGMRLLEVINDVLEVTRLESGNVELQLEYIDLGALITLAFEQEANAESGQRNLRLDIAPEVPLVKLDRWMFTRALNHLLDNAIKFTSPNGCIDVVVMSDAKGDVHIEVQDDGIGVRAEQLSRLTEAFYQADPSLARKHEGTGLGLFLTSKYLALHGARLELESEEGRGFTARIVLPHATAIHAGGGGGPLSRVAPGGHLEEATSSRSLGAAG